MRRETNGTVCLNFSLDTYDKRKIYLWNLTIVLCLLVLISALGTASAYQLPDSGQTKCYDAISPYAEIPCAGTGQDGEYNINPLSYFDNGDGTVTDNNTGLTWQQEDDGNLYNWYQASGTVDSTYNPLGSVKYCHDLILPPGGHIGEWRLPARNELASIIDYAFPYPGPTINSTYFPNTKISNHYYWTNTTGADDPVRKWVVWFQEGLVIEHIGGNTDSYVRCVRGLQAPGQSLANNLNGTVTDSSTGLTWQQDESVAMVWGDALSHCTSPWRLPNIRELDSITAYDRNPAIDTNFFPGAQANSYWSSTPETPDPSNDDSSRGMFLELGTLTRDPRTSLFNVRCVSGGILTCPDSAVTINGIPPAYTVIQDAYNLAINGDSIQMQALFFPENLLLARNNISLTLQGGYDCNFASDPGMTTIRGNLTIGGVGGIVTIGNVVIW